MKLTAMTSLTLDGVYEGPGRPDEDGRGGVERGGWLWLHLTLIESRSTPSGVTIQTYRPASGQPS